MNSDAAHLVSFLSGRGAAVEGLDEATWDRIVALAKRNGVAQLLPAAWKAQGIIPPLAVSTRAGEIRIACASRNIRLFHELDIVLSALQEENISVVPLKGAWLAESAYDDIVQRTMGDVDLWIRRDDLDAARRVLGSLGYSWHSREDRPQELQDALTGETQLIKKNAPLLELHWNIFRGEWVRHTARIEERDVWNRTIAFKGEMVRQLSPEDAILHLCVHLAVNHQMSSTGLRTLLDLDRIRRRWEIDWDAVTRRAIEWRISNAVWLVLRLLDEAFGDQERLLPLWDLRPSQFRRKILAGFNSLRSLVEGRDVTRGPTRFLYLLALVDRFSAAYLLVFRALFPDLTWLTLRYGLKDAPGWRVGLQRLWHPMRILLRRNI